MIAIFSQLADAIEQEGSAALVSLIRTEGSSPREAGARMVVRPSGAFNGSIGGGALEWEALARARAALSLGRGPAIFVRQSLGPQLGQCCGGQIALLTETFGKQDLASLSQMAAIAREGVLQTKSHLDSDGRLTRRISALANQTHDIVQLPDGSIVETFIDRASLLFLFGAGHVGRALILALAPLPFHVRWIDPRSDLFPSHVPLNVVKVQPSDVAAEIEAAPSGAFVLVMTHSHALDFEIVSKALAMDRFAYVGLIGSQSKRGRFVRRLAALGVTTRQISRLTCPIGVAGITGKEPATIAAATAAQLLMLREHYGAEIQGRSLVEQSPSVSVMIP
jgi:xanthine dehydrogenase accessory factor